MKYLSSDAPRVRFLVNLKAGPTMLQTWLKRANGDTSGANYVDIPLCSTDRITPGNPPQLRAS